MSRLRRRGSKCTCARVSSGWSASIAATRGARLPVKTYESFADRDPRTWAVMHRMLAGVSRRKFARVDEPVGEELERSSSATSKTSVSELFVERTATALSELMSPRFDDVRLAVMMLDGMEVADATHVVALGITTDGVKIPVGLWEGSTENATLARTLLADLVDRGLDPEQAILLSSTAARRCGARSRTSSARARASLPLPQRAETSATCSRSATATRCAAGCERRGG